MDHFFVKRIICKFFCYLIFIKHDYSSADIDTFISLCGLQIQGALAAPWVPLNNTFGASWETSGFANSLPYDLLIIDMAGNQLVAPCALKHITYFVA